MNEIKDLIEEIKCCREHQCTVHISHNASHIVLTALQEKAERENPQPLTVEQLRQMDGEPVWIISCDEGYYVNGIWALVKFSNGFDELVFSTYGTVRYFSDYGKTWLAYRYKPKED